MSETEKERVVSPERLDEEDGMEQKLRPQYLDEFRGQDSIRQNLKVYIKAANSRSESLDHMLLLGPPGLGKTTLAYITANELGSRITTSSGPVIEKPGDLAAILTNLQGGEVLFIDEIHRLASVVEEILYPAMEEFEIDILVGEGPGARTVRLEIEPFTLVGATTRAGLLSSPLRDRFGIVSRFSFYDPEELKDIVTRSAEIFSVEITKKGAYEIAKRSRGTPRVANRLLKRVRDFAEVEGGGKINMEIARKALKAMQVDEHGFHELERRILNTIIEKFGGGPVGLKTISAAIGESKDAIEEVFEPYMVQAGFLARTSQGRVATKNAYEHLGYEYLEKEHPDQLWD